MNDKFKGDTGRATMTIGSKCSGSQIWFPVREVPQIRLRVFATAYGPLQKLEGFPEAERSEWDYGKVVAATNSERVFKTGRQQPTVPYTRIS